MAAGCGLVVLSAVLSAACRNDGRPLPDNNPASRPTRGGELVVSIRGEPQSFNWYARHDATTHLLTLLTQARVVRVNAATQLLEPWLAESWERSDDQRHYTLHLRPNVTFSDGVPFSAHDVVFSLEAAYSEGSAVADALRVDGQKLQAMAVDPLTLIITFPGPYGPGLRLLDNMPVLPKHKLEDSLKSGIATAWTTATPLDDIVGLGPFVPKEYSSGQRLVLTRNLHYFRKDAAGETLPYLDRLVVEIVPDQNAEVLRMQAGQLDTPPSEIRPEDYALLKRAADSGSLQLLDLGVALDPDSFWINLKPGAFAKDPRNRWIQRDEFRQAISQAVDRQAFADTVFLGAATPVFGPVTPANRHWYSSEIPHPSHDIVNAKRLLASIGLSDRNGDGSLEDDRGVPARFTLMTMKGQTLLERGAAVIRDELKKIGLAVDLVMLEPNALVQAFLSGQGYDAVYFHLTTTDLDPALNADFWMSTGAAHVWNLGQTKPTTPWEQQIDDLMVKQMTTLDEDERRRTFVDVQRIFAEHAPVLYFAAPRVFAVASKRMMNLSPAISRPQLLWSADTIAVQH